MDIQQTLKALRQEFPGRPIICIPPEDPEEVIVELDRNADIGTAVALIKRSKRHVHQHTRERYVVESGTLLLEKDLASSVMHKGDRTVILPGQVHQAKSLNGDFVRVRVTSEPPWSPEDHHLVEES